jgi:ubiquinone/menaquinone biosynthesis C-methylase UbiE
MKNFVLLAAAVLAFGQAAQEANRPYQTKEGRAGIASALDQPGRDARQKPAELVKSLGIRPGSTVVDLGTGPGYMLPFLSSAVGPDGKVIAEDIAPDFIDLAREKAGKLGLKNVSFVLGTAQDPHLAFASADFILVLDAYHHFDYPDRMLDALRRALRPGGRLGIVEYYKRRGAMEGDPDRALTHIRLDADGVIREVESNGFRLASRWDHIPESQYVATFEPK